MTSDRPARVDAATAGMHLVGAMVGAAAIGYGAGSLIGIAVPLGLVGLFAGLVGGLFLVHARYKRI